MKTAGWWTRELLTDREGLPDTGRVATTIAILVMLGLATFDVVVQHASFRPQELGLGIGAILGGLGPYLWGDSRRAPAPPSGGVAVNIERG